VRIFGSFSRRGGLGSDMLTWRKGSGEQETLKFDRRAEDMEKTRQNTQGINGCDVNVKKHLSIDSKDKGSVVGSKTENQREGKQGYLDG
jgi:hypothetical protein